MTTVVDIANRALQTFGHRTNVTAAELAANSTNEAIQINLIFDNTRDDLSRMAPWNCCFTPANLVYITSAPSTPENTSTYTGQWAKGLPAPGWQYEYQYPEDCLRACYLAPGDQGAQGTPIFPVSTGYAGVGYQSAPIRFKVGVDQFYPVTAASVVSGGTGYAVGDLITLPGTVAGSAPIGAPAVLRVLTLSGSAVATVEPVSVVSGSTLPSGGSYFSPQSNPVAQDSTTGSGTGATFNLTFGAQGDQRVILCNLRNPVLFYCKRVTDPNVMDTLFQSAWIQALGANLCVALTGDKGLANMMLQLTNRDIEEARKQDGNEGLTVNDVMPDWLRVRGITRPDLATYSGFDWGATWPLFS